MTELSQPAYEDTSVYGLCVRAETRCTLLRMLSMLLYFLGIASAAAAHASALSTLTVIATARFTSISRCRAYGVYDNIPNQARIGWMISQHFHNNLAFREKFVSNLLSYFTYK